MIAFSDWFANLLVQVPTLRKKFQQKTIDGFLGNKLPSHVQAVKICETVGETPYQVQEYITQLEKILRWHQTPKGEWETHVIMYHPKAAPRPRFSRFGKTYNEKSYTDWKKGLADILRKSIKPSQNVQIDVEFHFVVKNATWGPHRKKPDGDNLLKAFQDSLQLAGFVLDDAQLWDVRVRKFYSHKSRIICRIRK